MINKPQYEKFLKSVTDELEGDWILIGGSLLIVVGASTRATADIDICPLGEMDNEKRLSLMDIAVKSNLPIEAINSSADFFLRKIPNWKSSLALLLAGKKGNIYRPSLELYFQLKLARGSDSDLDDCKSFLIWNRHNKIDFSEMQLKQIVFSFKNPKYSELMNLIES